MHYRPFHHGPCCSHKASYLSQASLLMEGKAQEQNCTGCHAPLHSWADVGLCGAVLQELSCSLLSSSLHFPSSSTHGHFSVGQVRSSRTVLKGYTEWQSGKKVLSGWEQGQIREVGGQCPTPTASAKTDARRRVGYF